MGVSRFTPSSLLILQSSERYQWRIYSVMLLAVSVSSAVASGTVTTATRQLAQAAAPQPPGWSSSQAESSAITLRELSLVRRDLEDLAPLCRAPLPSATRQQSGPYFWQLVTALAKLPAEQMSSPDYVEIGRLTADFEEIVQEVKGKLTMVVAKNDLPPQIPGKVFEEKVREFDERLSIMEKVKINGDFTFLPQADSGRGIKDTMAANMRARVNFQCKINEPPANGLIGDAKLFLRLVGASGRFFPRNKYLMSPENDVVDYSANPFNNVFDANALANNETLQFLNTQF